MLDSCPNEPPSRRQLSAWLQEKLFERRIVLITGQLDDAVAAEVSAEPLRAAWASHGSSRRSPWLVEEEFGRQRTPTATAADRVQRQAARETPAKTTRTVPLEFKDNATGEMLDVVQDNDPDLPPERGPK